ncbi:MAG: JAB domain-containing protein [Candidatus Woesearchaeota archaeon]
MQLFKNYFGNEVKIHLVRENNPAKECLVKSSKDVYELVKDELKKADREIFLAVSLNTRNKVLGINTVSVGSLNASLVHPREVFKPAILQNATGLILVHNHPSGEEKPSREDLEITARLVEAGKLIGIDVIDHIIVGNKFYSFADNDLIKHS